MDMEFITKSRSLIESRNSWINGAPARDMHGNMVDIFSPHAHCWCMFASLQKVAVDYPVAVYQRCYDNIRGIVREEGRRGDVPHEV